MTKPKNDPITLELPAYVVDMLADFARLDGRIIGPTVVPGEKRSRAIKVPTWRMGLCWPS